MENKIEYVHEEFTFINGLCKFLNENEISKENIISVAYNSRTAQYVLIYINPQNS